MNLRIDEPDRKEGAGDSEEEGMEIVSRRRKIMNGVCFIFRPDDRNRTSELNEMNEMKRNEMK